MIFIICNVHFTCAYDQIREKYVICIFSHQMPQNFKLMK